MKTDSATEMDRNSQAPGTNGSESSSALAMTSSLTANHSGEINWEEKREAPRFNVDIPLVANDSRGMMVRGSCRNVSEGGVCAAFAAQFAMDEELTLRIALPETAIELPLRVVVRHVAGKRYGFKFVELSDVQREQLRQLRNRCRTAARGLVAMSEVATLPAERFSILANRLVAVRNSRRLKVVHVTSSIAGEGKSLIAANLAATLARRPQTRVLLFDGDLRRPALGRLLGLGDVPGLCEWWEEGAQQDTAPLYRIGDLPFWLLPAGKTEHPADVLHSPRTPELLMNFADNFDWVIVDSPPLLPVADASLWAHWADGTLMVARAGLVSRSGLQKAIESFDGAKLLGFILNDASEDLLPYYRHYYGTENKSSDSTSSVRLLEE